MAFSQDGDTLATSAGADDAAVRLWHVRDRRSPVPGVVLAVNSALTLAFSPAGDVLVAGGVLGDLHAWNVTDPDNPVALDTDTSSGADKPAFTAVAFRPDGTSFVAADDSAAVSVGVRQRGEHPEDSLVLMSAGLVGQGGEQTVAFSPDGRHLLTGDRNGGVDLWTTPLPILSGGIGPDDQHGTTFNSDGTLVVSNADPQSPTDRVRLWELDTSSRPTLAATLPSQWKHAAFLSDGRTLLAEKPLGDTLGLWDIADPRHPRLAATIAETEQKHAADQAELGSPESATNRDGLLAVSLRSGAGVQLWNIHDARHPLWSRRSNSTRERPGAHRSRCARCGSSMTPRWHDHRRPAPVGPPRSTSSTPERRADQPRQRQRLRLRGVDPTPPGTEPDRRRHDRVEPGRHRPSGEPPRERLH
jgi:hypothetical protein